MKLKVKIAETSCGRVLALFDEHGKMLPGQTKVMLSGEVGTPPKLTVEFVVGGEAVALVAEQAG